MQVCRYSRAGKVRSPTWHGELWVAGLYVAMIQLGGGVGSIVPENFIECDRREGTNRDWPRGAAPLHRHPPLCRHLQSRSFLRRHAPSGQAPRLQRVHASECF